MLLPNTSEIWGMPAAEAVVMSRKPRPPGTKISLCAGRSAPPLSVSAMVGRRFSRMISLVRRFFRSVYGLLAPPRIVGSLPVIMHSTPSTNPMPLTVPAPTG